MRICTAGVKLGPIYQGVHPLDPLLMRSTDTASGGLPIVIHMAATFSSGCRSSLLGRDMDQVAVTSPT